MPKWLFIYLRFHGALLWLRFRPEYGERLEFEVSRNCFDLSCLDFIGHNWHAYFIFFPVIFIQFNDIYLK